MHFALLREHVRNELGGEPEEVFAAFDLAAFAAASLGQVHRARLKSGEEVAVKIQYPGIGTTVRADFRNLSALLLPLRVSKDWENLKAQLEDLRRVLEGETDYEKEAEFQRRACSLFREDDRIVVPRVYEQHSTRRVLTTELLGGVHVHDFLAGNPSQELRDQLRRPDRPRLGPAVLRRPHELRRPAPGQLPLPCRTAGSACSTSAASGLSATPNGS